MARLCVIIVDGAGGGNSVYDGDGDDDMLWYGSGEINEWLWCG